MRQTGSKVGAVKGILFNLLEDVLGEAFGPEAWDQLLCAADVRGVYAALGTYPDAEFFAIIDATAGLTGRTRDAVLLDFGEAAFPRMVDRYPNFLTGVDDARTFLLSLNRIMTTEVRKLYAGAGCPQFRFAIAPRRLRIGYTSPRRMCALAQGLIRGVAHHFQEEVDVSHPECMHRGDAACRVDVIWSA